MSRVLQTTLPVGMPVSDQRMTRSDAGASAAVVLKTFGIVPEDLAAVARLGEQPGVDPAHLVRDFYRWLGDQPWMGQFFGDGVPDRVRGAQVAYWGEFLRGRVDDAYVASRMLVGETHARIGLPPRAYTAAMAFSERWLFAKSRESALSEVETAAAIAGVSALCQLDASLVMDAYADHSGRRIQAEADKLAATNRELTRVIVAASEGSFAERYVSQSEDDVHLALAVNQMIDNFRTVVQQAKAIASGDYSSEIQPRSEKDELGRVIAEMTKALRDATERTRRDQWLREGQAEIFERMRGELSTEGLARAVLEYLAKRVGAPVACIYVPDADGTLVLAGAYGRANEDVRARIKLGEGVVGEVALQREPVFDLDVSASPVRGVFGLGEVCLNTVAILPLMADEQLRGVLELALPAPLSDLSTEFVHLVAENIAIGLNGAGARSQMETLLLQSRKQGEALQAQAGELRASNEELEERSRALQRAREELETKNQDLQRKQTAIEQASAKLEERADDLALASKYKSEFLANMSHELRTPLNSMLLLTGGLFENRDGNLTPKQLESLRVVRSGGEDLLRIINDVLDLSKVEAGKLAVESRNVTIESVVESLRGQFGPVAEKKDIALLMEVDASAPATIQTDPQRLAQILRNLLGNALKFTHDGEVRLRISGRRGQSSESVADARSVGAVAISVSDTGIGIPKDKRRAIFEAFQQADGSTTRTYGGTGLGLAISRRLAGLLGGEIELESQEGVGSTFTLVLPSQPDRGTSENVSSVPDTNGADSVLPSGFGLQIDPNELAEISHVDPPEDSVRSLLIVEDDTSFRTILSEMAIERGYRPIPAASGKEGLVLAERLCPSGIVLDLGLPDVDGMKALSQLKSHRRTRHIPVHVISGHPCMPESLELGAMGFLQKPVDAIHVRDMFQRFERLWNRKTGRVLVVEDDPDTQAAIRDLLGADGVTLLMASTGSEGLAELAGGDIDCVVVDLGLPDMAGTEFLQSLGESHPPVVVYTASELDDQGLAELSPYTQRVVVKGVESPARLLDEVSLFLHQAEADMTDAQQATLHKLHRRERELDGRTVLVVEDDMRNMFAMTELLQRYGVRVLQARNGQVALEVLQDNAVTDLVIMDIMMPVMDGFEAIRRIRAQQRFETLPIVAVTAKTLPEDRQACLTAGASDYITKPMDPENLVALMRVLLFDNRSISPEDSVRAPV